MAKIELYVKTELKWMTFNDDVYDNIITKETINKIKEPGRKITFSFKISGYYYFEYDDWEKVKHFFDPLRTNEEGRIFKSKVKREKMIKLLENFLNTINFNKTPNVSLKEIIKGLYITPTPKKHEKSIKELNKINKFLSDFFIKASVPKEERNNNKELITYLHHIIEGFHKIDEKKCNCAKKDKFIADMYGIDGNVMDTLIQKELESFMSEYSDDKNVKYVVYNN